MPWITTPAAPACMCVWVTHACSCGLLMHVRVGYSCVRVYVIHACACGLLMRACACMHWWHQLPLPFACSFILCPCHGCSPTTHFILPVPWLLTKQPLNM